MKERKPSKNKLDNLMSTEFMNETQTRIPEGFEIIKTYPLNPPFSYVNILYNNEKSNYLYHVDELKLNHDEMIIFENLYRAIELAQRVLNDDPRERKYIFVITDGHATGYDKIHETFAKLVKKVDVSDITLVAIGVSKKVSKTFKKNAQGHDLKTLVTKFITAYRSSSSDM